MMQYLKGGDIMKKLNITKEQFKEKYLNMTNVDLAKEIGVSKPTVQKIANDLGISKGKGYHHRISFNEEGNRV